jgi:D-alanine transaminase
MTRGPGSPAWAWFDGRIVPFSTAVVPLEDRGLQFGESVYEVVAVVDGRPFRLADHVERMLGSARELALAAGVPPLAQWESLVDQLHTREPQPTAVLYAQLTGGAAPREFVPEHAPVPLFFAYLRAHDFPDPPSTTRGISAVTAPETRWRRRDIKTTMLLPAVLARRAAASQGAGEVLFVGQDGFVNEGAASTMFIVRGRTVATPPPTDRLLPGVSSLVVREICEELRIPFETRALTLSDLATADEVFLASTVVLVMPVVRVDGRPVGGGVGGPTSLQIAYHFQRRFWAPLHP